MEEGAEVMNKQIGLTAIQERCAVLLAAGTSITEAAETLRLDRGTIYCWKKKVTFACYLNKLQEQVKDMLQGSMFDLQGQAVQALKESLVSQNEAIRLRAAMWLIERLSSISLGCSDPKEVIKGQCYEESWAGDIMLNEKKYVAALQKEGLDLNG